MPSALGGREGEDCADFGILIGCLIVGVTRVAFNPVEGLPFRGEGRVILCTPNCGTTGDHAYWRRLLDRTTVGRTELPNGPINVPEDSKETVPAPKSGILLSIVDGSLNHVPVSDLDQVVLKELMAENKGLTLLDLKKRSEYSSVISTSECSHIGFYDVQKSQNLQHQRNHPFK